jgi:hypothetical protein
LKSGGHPDYTLRILARANHNQWEAKIGSNAEMPSLQRFVPAYFTTIRDWLAKRIRGFGVPQARMPGITPIGRTSGRIAPLETT